MCFLQYHFTFHGHYFVVTVLQHFSSTFYGQWKALCDSRKAFIFSQKKLTPLPSTCCSHIVLYSAVSSISQVTLSSWGVQLELKWAKNINSLFFFVILTCQLCISPPENRLAVPPLCCSLSPGTPWAKLSWGFLSLSSVEIKLKIND